jgi:hypothetical protein
MYNYRGFDLGNHFNEYAGFDCDYSRKVPTADSFELLFKASFSLLEASLLIFLVAANLSEISRRKSTFSPLPLVVSDEEKRTSQFIRR